MQTPTNTFKQALQAGRPQIGLWLGLADAYVSELLAGTGYDWLLVDGEHAPNDLRSTLAQLQAIASARQALPAGDTSAHAVVRIPHGDAALIKQNLDIGAQTLLVPMVDTAEQAAHLAQACRYPPEGFRGMGSALARASRWQQYPGYIHEANAQVCLLVQAAIADGIARILKAGKAPGILSTTEEQARKWLDAGALFVAVGVDTILLKKAAMDVLAWYRAPAAPGVTQPPGY